MNALLCAVLLSAMPAAAAPEPVIFDTDTAYFHDDGAALALLLRRPDAVELVGVTVTVGNEHSAQGAEYMLYLLDLLKAKDVPLVMGATAPLANSQERAAEMGAKWKVGFKGALSGPPPEKLAPPFGGVFAAKRPAKGDAADFIIRAVEERPGQIILLAVGPMTNVARALAKKPSIAKKIKRLVFMGGSVRAPGNITSTAEFNFWFDPEAARAVLRAPIPEKVMFGLDVTNTVPLMKKDFDEIVASTRTPLTALYAAGLGDQWPGFNRKPEKVAYYWDALPAAWLLEPGLVTRWEELRLDVDTDHSTEGYGRVVLGGAAAMPVRTAYEFDRPRFWTLYKRLLTAPLD